VRGDEQEVALVQRRHLVVHQHLERATDADRDPLVDAADAHVAPLVDAVGGLDPHLPGAGGLAEPAVAEGAGDGGGEGGGDHS
jgi:hypothetical protein